MSIASKARSIVPFALRVELLRLRAMPRMRRERSSMALEKVDLAQFPTVIAEHLSPLKRDIGEASRKLQKGKEQNIKLASQAIDRICIEPGQIFSYHHAVGRPSRLRGFRYGLELKDGEMAKGIGGGCCSVSNMLYILALRAGLEVTERHRHQLDLFPDCGRTIPFGCGATVFYPNADLRIRNPHDFPVVIHYWMEDECLKGSIQAENPLEFQIEIEEVGHHFTRDAEGWTRENRIIRKFIHPDGTVFKEEEVAHNQARCLYEPEAN